MLFVQLQTDGREVRVQRTHLAPQAVELLREVVWRHVVHGPPHGARVGEPELARAFVRQLDEPSVLVAHGRGDCVPPPDLAQPLLVARRGHDLGDVIDVQAGLALLRVRAPLALAIVAFRLAAIRVNSSDSFGSAVPPSRATPSAS